MALSGLAIEARGLTKRFGDFTAVNGIDLVVPQGICFGLLGPNGAGKTTTIRMIQCASPVSGGELHVLGMDVRRDSRAIKQRIGLVPQEENLDPDFTVEQNLSLYGRFFGIGRAQAAKRARELLTFMKLEDRGGAHIMSLSGGMKRRLIVARGLVNDPDLLILDEPTTGLDPQARHVIWDNIRDLRRKGKTILLTTHYMDEAEMLCDTLVVVDKGAVLEQGTPAELIARHTGGEAAEFVAEPDVLAGLEAELADQDLRHERLSDRVIVYGDSVEKLATKLRRKHAIDEVRLRRASLEDVFLRLTGRALRD